jgi:hypothetical protein
MLRTLATLVLVASISSVLNAQDRTDLWRRYAQNLPPQTLVVVVLKNGKSIRGHLVQVTDDRLVVLRKTRLPVPPSAFALDDVDSIEPQKQTMSPGAKVLVGVGSTVGVAFVLFAIALAGSR